MKNAEEGRTYWERHARAYDASLRALYKPLPRMCELVAEAVRGAELVLEVAAGTGLVTTAVSRSAREVVATDYSESMIGALGEKLLREGISNVTAEHANIYELPYEAQSFDAVVAANVLHLVPDLPGALAAFRRVLKPGGKLVVPTFLHDETWVSSFVSRVVAVTGFPSHRRLDARSLRSALEQQGITVVREETLAGLIPVGYVEGRFDRS